MNKMVGNVAFAVLVVAFGAGTVMFGWWTIPLIGLIWGVIAPSKLQTGATAAMAAALSWGLLLSWTATQGPVGALARRVGSIFGVPSVAFFGITLTLAAVLAGSATLVAGALTPSRVQKTK